MPDYYNDRGPFYHDEPEDDSLVGKRIHHWTVIREAYGLGAVIPRYLCKCDCGNEKIWRKAEFKRLPIACSGCLSARRSRNEL